VGVKVATALRALPAAAPQPVRVLIADGEALVRGGVRALLEASGRLAVVGEAATGEEAIEVAQRVHPDVAVIDSRLPGLDTGDVIGQICSESGIAAMVLTASEEDKRTYAALRAGATGVLLKDTEPEALVHAVELVAGGEALLSPKLTRCVLAEIASRPEPAGPSRELVDELTAREREVVALVGHGLGNHEIAERLVVTPATAKTHVSRAMLKLHAHDRAKLVVFAYEAGLVVPRVRAGEPQLRALVPASS
jgi:DNA-binding NarL/FixJ family response regulator